MKKALSFSLASASVLAALSTFQVQAHGWVEYPSARQNTCYEDGGFWTNEIPNQACQAAFDASGAYPFVQRSEIAANVPNYRDMAHVKAIVPNGELCSAGDSAKAGLNIPSPYWQRTSITPDANNQIELVFFGKAPHNPSYWEFYLTKPSYDASLPLTWDDLDLIDTAGDIVVDEQKRYRMKVTFPADRSGDAILYTRWQRIDVVGEGFYNCSDITLRSGGTTPPTDPTDPPTEPGNNLSVLGYFVPQGFGPVESGDTVRLRTFDATGAELVDISLAISANNTGTWAAELAGQFNGQQHKDWYIGIWHQEMNHYMYDSSNLFANQVHAPSANFSYALSLIKADTTPPTLPTNGWGKDKVYVAGDVVSHNGREWTAQWWTTGEEPGTTGEWGVWR
ncbi:lytic polysaccharide monooxygenase [Vibrio vulnificus]|uniref:lytic polysaccharide monooxygenase n=1 Tax=Vibrio vulnificus TaxID=672 RepID=UPI000316BC25|nr:lytic polysaccharide monooxygenase [Vibrio vulnificus]ELE1905143.1 lytic polysaccharide monooxygenase [Vibrio vulnificus]MCU8183016.1 lytic polysaccharide monooxygenase [Vibrio vulnificus]RZP70451.1 Spindolin [Vibrio vulnificus]HAS6935226.1 Spindolin [Vibrio vulnificus]